MKKSALYFLSLLYLLNFTALAQKRKVQAFQAIIQQGIKKAYPASVRMWSYDVQAKERTGSQFSGVVISPDGYIFTAAHTVSPGKNYKVFFPNGKECIAIALGRIDNKETPGIPDVGMMKITDPGTWPFAEIGYSKSLLAGEPCISISYPETLNQSFPTVRLGAIAEVKNTYGFIRSTCKMEPGDSGGPLFDYMGRVIGIHSAIDVNEDQNFEIPVNLFQKYRTALLKEINYTQFPQEVDSVSADPLLKKIQTDLNSGRLKPELNVRMPYKKCAFPITSELKGVSTVISGTLINIKAAGNKNKQVFLSKNSMIGFDPTARVNGVDVKLRVFYRDQDHDLALLKFEGKIQGGIELNPIPEKSRDNLGSLLYTLKPDGNIIQSVLSCDTFSLAKIASQGYLGAMVAYNSSPVLFSLIKPESPAGRAGLKVGDELVSINGKSITHARDFAPMMMRFWPDDEIGFEWISNGEKHAQAIVLEARPQAVFNHPAEKFKGGKSIRRDGFFGVVAHDAAILPSECGTPVFDLDGNFYGINIARFSRTASLILPAIIIQKAVNDSTKQ